MPDPTPKLSEFTAVTAQLMPRTRTYAVLIMYGQCLAAIVGSKTDVHTPRSPSGLAAGIGFMTCKTLFFSSCVNVSIYAAQVEGRGDNGDVTLYNGVMVFTSACVTNECTWLGTCER